MQVYIIALFVLLCLLAETGNAFSFRSVTSLHSSRTCTKARSLSPQPSPFTRKSQLNASGFYLADGLDEEAMKALGDVQDADVGALIDTAANPVIGKASLTLHFKPSFLFDYVYCILQILRRRSRHLPTLLWCLFLLAWA